MTRRITCYVVFATLIWGAHTETKQRRPDMFKSNMTRTDFSNLLSSLIKLNEQRVSVLQKLNRLEDYGVLSEVLRSSDKKTKNGNPSSLYLIVMSKNTTDSSHRNSGYHLVDSVTSLEVAGSNNIPKLDFVLDPASFVFQNSSQENKSPQPIFANTPRFYKQKKKYIIGDRIFTKTPLQYRSVNQKRKHIINFLKAPKYAFQATESRKIEIVNKSSKATQRREKYSTTVVSINDQSPKYNKIELTKHNVNKLATKPIAIKDILRRKRKKPKNYLEGNVENNEDLSSFLFNISLKEFDKVKDITQLDGDMFTKQFFGNNLKPKTDKDILKVQKNERIVSVDSDFADDSDYSSDSRVTDISDKKIDVNHLPKPETDKVISKLTDISSKTINNNHRKPVKDKVISKITDISVKRIPNNHRKPLTDKVISKVTDISVKRIHNHHHKPRTEKVISNVTDISVKRIHNNHRKPLTDKVISKVINISVKRIHNHHRKPRTEKVISKVTDISVKRIHNRHRKPGTDKVISKVTDISVKKIDDNNQPKPETKKVISKVNGISAKNIDDNNNSKPGKGKVISKVNDVPLKNIDYYNHPKPETNQDTLKAKFKLIQNKSNLLNLDDKTSRIETERRTTVLKNPDPIINDTVSSDNASDHTVFYTSPIPNPNLNINRYNAYANNLMAYLRRKNATMKTNHENGVSLITTDITLPVAASNILAPFKFPTTPKNTPNRDNLDFWNPNNSKDNSKNNKMKTAKDLHNGDNHSDAKPKKIKDYDHEENNNNGKKSNELFTLVVTDEGKGRAMRMKVMPDLQLAPNGFDQSEIKPVERMPFQNCISKKSRKLCYKSCKSAYRNVCRRMSCSSRSKRALKRQCKRSCKKTFEYSKYSDESGSTGDGSRSDDCSDDSSDDSSDSTDSDES